jgi:type II secretory pathway pseudopilin PulG
MAMICGVAKNSTAYGVQPCRTGDPVARRLRPDNPPGGRSGRAYGRCGGFTYIILLLLVAMMSLALTQAVPMWQTVQQRDKEEELLFVGAQFRRAIARYYAAGGAYPRQLEDLVKDPRFPGVRRFLRKVYPDPITGSAEWGLVKLPGDLITGVYSLSQAEPIKKADFSLADQGFEGKMKYSEWLFVPKVGASAGASPAGANPNAPALAPGTAPNLPESTQPQPGMTPPGLQQRRFGSPQR